VIKIKSKNNAEKEGKMEEDLRREISVMKNLKHTNCLMVRDLFRTVHKVYIVMDFMPNGSVGSYVRKYDGISEWQAKSWFCPIARAVRYLHESLVAHRDIKLDNILLDRHWNPMLTDFGFSRFVSMDTNTREAQKSDTFCGTPPHGLSD
jgi:serine/threonine protein kinase